MPDPSPDDVESGGAHAAGADGSSARRASEDELAGACFLEEDHTQRFTEDFAVEFAQWQETPNPKS